MSLVKMIANQQFKIIILGRFKSLAISRRFAILFREL